MAFFVGLRSGKRIKKIVHNGPVLHRLSISNQIAALHGCHRTILPGLLSYDEKTVLFPARCDQQQASTEKRCVKYSGGGIGLTTSLTGLLSDHTQAMHMGSYFSLFTFDPFSASALFALSLSLLDASSPSLCSRVLFLVWLVFELVLHCLLCSPHLSASAYLKVSKMMKQVMLTRLYVISVQKEALQNVVLPVQKTLNRHHNAK